MSLPLKMVKKLNCILRNTPVNTNLKLVTKCSLQITFIQTKTLNWSLIVKAQLLWPPQNEPRPNCSTSRIRQCEEPQLCKTKTVFQKYWPVCGHLNLHSQMCTLKLQLGPRHAQHNCQHLWATSGQTQWTLQDFRPIAKSTTDISLMTIAASNDDYKDIIKALP